MTDDPRNSMPGIHSALLLKGIWPKLMQVKKLAPWLLPHEREFLENEAKSVVEHGYVSNTGKVELWCDDVIAKAEKRKAKAEAVANVKRLARDQT